MGVVFNQRLSHAEEAVIQSSDQTPRRPRVITLGLDGHDESESFRQEIEALGLALVKASDAASIQDMVRTERAGAVMVYSPRSASCAADVLDRLKEQGASAAVVVITDQPDYGQYFDVMNRGAADYLSINDRPDRIARAVRLAAGAYE